jgi:hypothetical protein
MAKHEKRSDGLQNRVTRDTRERSGEVWNRETVGQTRFS